MEKFRGYESLLLLIHQNVSDESEVQFICSLLNDKLFQVFSPFSLQF